MEEQILINFRGNDIIVKFPKVWQLLEIENLKMTLTNNNYDTLSKSNLATHSWLLDTVDAISYLQVLAPELKDILKVKSLASLNPKDMKELTTIYVDKLVPWLKRIMDDLMTFDKTEDNGGEK